MAEPVRDGRRMQNQQEFGESDEAGLFCSPPPGGGKKKKKHFRDSLVLGSWQVSSNYKENVSGGAASLRLSPG